MGNFTRLLLNDAPELVDEHYDHAALLVRVREIASVLPDVHRTPIEKFCDAFVDLRTRYEDEVVEGVCQADIVGRLSRRVDHVERILGVACGYLSTTPQFANTPPDQILGMLEDDH